MIGWYAHHQGLGHLTRARCTIAGLDEATRRRGVTVLSSHPAAAATLEGLDADVIALPMDLDAPRSAACEAAPPPAGLHYAPLGVDGVRNRMAQIAAWVEASDPDLVVVDVSVEVAALMRLLSVPTAVVRQHGRRDDDAHLACYAGASLLLAPYPEWLEEDWAPGWMRHKTVYVGGFSRVDDRIGTDVGDAMHPPPGERIVVVLDGTGGSGSDGTGAGGEDAWPVGDAAAATPGWRWIPLGRAPGSRWVEDPYPWLRAADVVVTHAGHNAVMEVAAARRPTIVVPQPRPFDEQAHKAVLLQATGTMAVEAAWPDAARWPGLLEEVASRDVAGSVRLVDGHGARRAALALTEAARHHRRQVQPA